MRPILVLYATREGQTTRIVRYLADTLLAHGAQVELLDARKIPAGFSLENYSVAVIAAPVHIEKHAKEIVRFAKTHVQELNRMPSIFLSISLSQAGAEMQSNSIEQRAQAAAAVQRMIDGFLEQTGWHPSRTVPVAGALMYSKYNFVIRFVLKRIAARSGGSTDTSRDHVYTHWATLDRLAEDLATARSSPAPESSREADRCAKR